MHRENMPVTGEIKIWKIPSLILAYKTIHYSAPFLLTLQIKKYYVSRKALKAVSVYFV